MPQISLKKSLGGGLTPPPIIFGHGEGLQLSGQEQLAPFGQFPRERLFFIGAPRYRTLWEVQQFAVEAAIEFLNFEVGEEFTVQLEFVLILDGVPSAINIIQAKIPAATKPAAEVIPGKKVLTRHIYILEPFSLLALDKARPLYLLVKFTNEKAPLGEGVFYTLSAVIIKGLTIISQINQEFIRRPQQLRSQ